LTLTLLQACQGALAPQKGMLDVDGGVLDCQDGDGDGYGVNCALGADCDDADASATYECRHCARPERGCPCAAEQPAQPCFERSEPGEGDARVCHEGTRYCRDGLWSACEDVRSYVVSTTHDETAAINDGVTPENCDPCLDSCFAVTEPLGDVDGSVVLAAGGGIPLPPDDAGPVGGGGDDAGSVVISGGPVPGCTFGVPPDADCDGIPDDFDELPDDVARALGMID
jgi:hypothetical protein